MCWRLGISVSAEGDVVDFIIFCLILFVVLISIDSGITRHLACSDGAPLELRGQSDLAAQQDVGNPTKQCQSVSHRSKTVRRQEKKIVEK